MSGCSLKRQPVFRKFPLALASSEVDPPRQPDQDAGGNSQDQVKKQRSFELLAFELPLPRRQSRCNYRHGSEGSNGQIEIGCRCERCTTLPLGSKIKRDAHHKQRDGEMNKHNMLRVTREQGRFQVKSVHTRSDRTTTLPVILGWIEQKYV